MNHILEELSNNWGYFPFLLWPLGVFPMTPIQVLWWANLLWVAWCLHCIYASTDLPQSLDQQRWSLHSVQWPREAENSCKLFACAMLSSPTGLSVSVCNPEATISSSFINKGLSRYSADFPFATNLLVIYGDPVEIRNAFQPTEPRHQTSKT